MTSSWTLGTKGGLDAQSLAGTQTLPSARRASETRWLSMKEIVEHRPKMVQCVEDGSLSRVATATFGHLAAGTGLLNWSTGAIPQFITKVLDHFGLHPPPESQVYQLYTAFDRDKNGSLSLSESLRLVEAIVRAAFNIKSDMARQNTSSSSSVMSYSPAGDQLKRPSQSVLYPGSGTVVSAPPLAQLATQALPVPSGAPVSPGTMLPSNRGYRLAQEWIEGYSVQPLTQTTMSYTPRRRPVDIADFSGNFRDTAEANAHNISRIKASLENMTLLKEALEIFGACDHERKGYLSWDSGEIQSFISRVFKQQGLISPRQEQIRALFAAFDLDGNGRLEPRECMCMVDALARSIILAQPPGSQAWAAGATTVPAYSLAEQWLADFRPTAVQEGLTVRYWMERKPVDLRELAVHLRTVGPHNARHKARMIHAIETGEFLKEALQVFKECDRDRNGQLTWNEREIPLFFGKVFRKYDLVEPKEAELYEIYRKYDVDQSYSLDVRESLCLVDAVVRAMYLDDYSPRSNRSANRVSFSEEVSPVQSAGSHVERRRLLSDQEAARRVALQEAATEQQLELLIRRRNEAIRERDTLVTLFVVLGAWRQFAVHELAARMKEEWNSKLAEAERKLREEQRSFQSRLEDELDRQRSRALDTTTSIVSAAGYAEAAAQAEEEAEQRFKKERHLWETRCKEERERRESLQVAQAAAIQKAAAEAERRAEARFEEERQIFEQRLKEERDKRNRAEAAKAQALDHYLAEVRTQKKNAVQKVIDSLFSKTRKTAAGQLKQIASSWLDIAKAGARRRRRVDAVDKAVMSWGRKAMSGRPGPSFNAWRDVVRARRRARAAVGVLERQWLGGRKGLVASYFAEWRSVLDLKRQTALKAKRRAKAHAQIALLLSQWERGKAAGLVTSYMSAWKRVADASAKVRARRSRCEAVQLALQKWLRGSTRGLLHEAMRLWRKLYGRGKQALLVSQCLVAWEQKAEVGLVHTCFAAWLKIVSAAASKRRKARSHEAVVLALQKWERGSRNGLLHETMIQWFKVSVARRRHMDLVKKSLVSWELEAGVSLTHTCFTAWSKLLAEARSRHIKQQQTEAVALALQKWERGNEKGLLHEVLDQWYKLFVPRSRQAAMLSSYLVSWEMEAEVGLTQTCFSAWRHLVQGEARRRLQERSREGVHLAVQKFLLGNQKGLLHEALSLWQHLCAKHAQRDLLLKKYLVSFEMETGVGLTQTCLASWKKLVDAQARQRSKEHGHEAVKLALQKWERGNAAGLLHEVVTQWQQLCEKQRQRANEHESIQLALQKWERGSTEGLLHEVVGQWNKLCSEKRAKGHAREAVALALQKWERGNIAGLLHEVVHEWQKISAEHRRKASEHESVQLALQKWERGTVQGLLLEVVGQWHKLCSEKRAKGHGREAVTLALQKWERGNVAGLLHEVVHEWQKLFAGRRRKAKLLDSYLISMEAQAGVGLLGSFYALWKHQVQVDRRQRAKAHGREAVHLALQKWERGNTRGLLAETVSEWHRVWQLHKGKARRERSHQAVLMMLHKWRRPGPQGTAACALSVWARLAVKRRGRSRAAAAMERQVARFLLGRAGAMRQAVFSEWLRLLQESKQRLKHQRAHAVVEVALSQWEKGQTKGLMAVVVKDWHKYVEVTASNGRKIRGAGTLEEKLLLATLRLCLHGWRGHLDIKHARTSAKELRESLDMQRLNLVFAMWRLCNLEEKKEQAFGQVAEISAIAFELQQAQTSLLEDKILLEGKVEKAFEALQKELQTKEELAAELREAYSKQAHRSALLPDLPANLTFSPGAITLNSSFSQRAAADIAASVASANSNRPRSREGTPRADAEGQAAQGRTKVSPFLPGVSGKNGASASSGPLSELDWDMAYPRIEEMMKNMADGETPKAASVLASKGETAERFEALGRSAEQEDGLPGRVVAQHPQPVRASPRGKSPTAMAAERRRRKAAERAGLLDEEEEWV